MFKELVAECTDYDFKSQLEEKKPRDWLKSISAFANGIGGSLFFGIGDHGEVLGIEDIKHCSDKISELIKARMNPIPPFELIPLKTGGKEILEVRVFSGNSTPYYYRYDGIVMAYVRIGNSTLEASMPVLNQLILKGIGQTYDGILTGEKLEDYSFSILNSKFLNATGERLKPSDFRSFDLEKNGLLTRAGLLLADENRLRQSRIFCTRWNGNDKTGEQEALDDEELSGSLLKLLDQSMDFFRKNTKKPWKKVEGNTINQPDYDEEAVKEALVNAIIHRDYNVMGAEVCLNIYDDRMEITSPGMMFSGKKLPEVVDFTMESDRRNPIIADLFQRLNLMKRRGSGLANITNRTNALFHDTKNHVFFRAEDGFFSVTIFNVNYGAKLGPETEKSNVASSLKASDIFVTKNESLVLEQIQNGNGDSKEKLFQMTGIPARTLTRVLKALTDKGLIRRIGSKRKGKWEIIG